MSALQRFIETPLAHAIGWTLLHSLWEGAAIAVALAAVLLATKSPRVRYFAACAAMAAMLVAFGITLARLWPSAVPHYPVVRVDIFSAAPSATTGAATPSIEWRAALGAIAPWLAPFWIVGVCLLYVERIVAWFSLQRLVRRGVCYASEEWHQRLAELGHRMRVSKSVRLIESSLADVPMVVGHLRPIILMPLGVLGGLPADQVETILLHELAHIRRHDFLVNIFQRLIEGLLFYHPAVWWFSKVMRNERENCCDDVVVTMSEDRRPYALALEALERRRCAVREAAVAASGGSLVDRIRRLLYPNVANRSWTGMLAPVLALAIVAVLATASLGAKQAQTGHMAVTMLPSHPDAATAGKQTTAQTAISTPIGNNIARTAQGQLTALSQSLIDLKATSDSRVIYRMIGDLAGVTVDFAQPFVSRPISIDLRGVSLEQALNAAAKLSGTQWKATSEKTVLVTESDLTETVVRAFYMPSVTSGPQVNAIISQLNATFGDSLQVAEATSGAILVRGSPSDVALAGQLVANIVGAVNSTTAQTSSAANAWPDGAGRTEFLQSCSSCHAPDNVRGHSLSAAGWTDEVNRMKQLGMQISDQDFTAVVGYLGANFGAPQAILQPRVLQIHGSATAGGQLSVSIVDQPPEPYMKWLDEDVVYIISPEERDTFVHFQTNEERDRFINQFWERRNPTPGSAENTVKTEHYRRISYANENFAASVPGWQTDRGRVYIVYGAPDGKSENPAGVNGMFTNEVWRYHHIEGIGDNLILEFVDRDGHGDFKLAPATVNAQ